MAKTLQLKATLNPISKLIVVVFLGMTLFNQLENQYSVFIVLVFSILYYLYGRPMNAIRNIGFYILLMLVIDSHDYSQLHPILKMFLSFIVIIKMFYLPFMAGKFFLVTSDVSSIITSMDKLKIPMSFSIPISVMFRFFPSFKEEHENIKMAMKIRGITAKEPLNYLENVTIPLLMLSSNLTDDIAKSAETKCIADPTKKVRYRHVGFGMQDVLFILLIVLLELAG